MKTTAALTALAVAIAAMTKLASAQQCQPLTNASNFTEMGGHVYYTAADAEGLKLFRTDGTENSTQLVSEVLPNLPGYGLDNFHTVGNLIFFTVSDTVTGDQLWKTDGTAAGTALVKDLDPTSTQSLSLVRSFAALGSEFYFVADDKRLYKTDGSSAGTIPVGNIRVTQQDAMLQAGNYIYLNAETAATGQELWRTDGTDAGTILVKDIAPGTAHSYVQKFAAVGDTIYFTARAGSSTQDQLWKSDGMAEGTVVVSPSGQVGFSNVISTGDKLFYEAGTSITNRELWVKSATSAPVQVKEIGAGSAGADIWYPVVLNGVLYFTAHDGTSRSLWKSDGTSQGTSIVKQRSDDWQIGIVPLVVSGGVIYFTAQTPTTGIEVWKSDGSPQGTELVKDFVPGSEDANPFIYAGVAGHLYVTYTDSTNLFVPYKIDGSTGHVIPLSCPESVKAGLDGWDLYE